MELQQRIRLLTGLGEYMKSHSEFFELVKHKAAIQNPWFTPTFISLAIDNAADNFLQKAKLEAWAKKYNVPNEVNTDKMVGIVMAGNIPLVGFHDLLCVFVSGFRSCIKLSSKDDVLIKHLVQKMYEWDITIQNYISFSEQLKGCDAYIATGSNNSGRYFEYYFGRYPNIIRSNRTSVAILDGTETAAELGLLADDIQLYFGLGCRNVTKVYVPEGYDFVPLLNTLKKYDYLADFHKYKHNFDYHLTLLIMNNKFYMTNESVIFTENESPFSPVSQVHYSFYENKEIIIEQLKRNTSIQCVVGHGFLNFGQAQVPTLNDYADGLDTMAFLSSLQ
ncbi:MAG TPA: acyl-CoA reductase [Panacibacter sp.]|nr:acyl-CoA reductase [Panacibacter sp.]